MQLFKLKTLARIFVVVVHWNRNISCNVFFKITFVFCLLAGLMSAMSVHAVLSRLEGFDLAPTFRFKSIFLFLVLK